MLILSELFWLSLSQFLLRLMGQHALRLFLEPRVLNLSDPSRWLTFHFVISYWHSCRGGACHVDYLGAVRSRAILGPGFYVVHLILFFISVPSLANLLVLRQRRGFVASWYIAAALCTMLAFFLVLLQYSVSEALYGIA